MEILSVTLIVLAGVTISSLLERLLFGLQYDLIAVASFVVVFGGAILALMLFLASGIRGVLLTALLPMLLHPVFVKVSLRGTSEVERDQGVWGGVYWVVLLIIFTIAGLKSWIISVHLGRAYSLTSGSFVFYFTFGIFLLAGSLSMIMLIHELKSRHGR
jgi:hypothetical protein